MPVGRKIKQALMQERRREGKEAKMQAVSRVGDSLSTGHICALTTTIAHLIQTVQ